MAAQLPAPVGRMMMLPHLSEQIRLRDGHNVRFSGEERTGSPLAVYGANYLAEFRLEAGLPVWRYQVGEIAVEKRILLPHQQNTVFVIYRLIEGPDHVRLKLMPSVQFRPHDGPVSTPLPKGFRLFSENGRHELSAGFELPTLRMKLFGQQPAFTSEPQYLTQLLYRLEESRGYDSQGDLWSPGYFRVDLARGENVALGCRSRSERV